MLKSSWSDNQALNVKHLRISRLVVLPIDYQGVTEWPDFAQICCLTLFFQGSAFFCSLDKVQIRICKYANEKTADLG